MSVPRTQRYTIGDLAVELVPASNGVPPHIEIGDESLIVFVWRKDDALQLAHKLMSLAHQLAYLIEEHT